MCTMNLFVPLLYFPFALKGYIYVSELGEHKIGRIQEEENRPNKKKKVDWKCCGASGLEEGREKAKDEKCTTNMMR